MSELGLKLFITPATILVIRRNGKNNMPSWIKFTDKEKEKIRRLYAEGVTIQIICIRFGCSWSAIKNVVKPKQITFLTKRR
jgi:hypothetical protein